MFNHRHHETVEIIIISNFKIPLQGNLKGIVYVMIINTIYVFQQ